MTKEELERLAFATVGEEIEDLSSEDLANLMTFGQYIIDRCLAESESRGEIEFEDGRPVLPYNSDHIIENVLTREVH